MKAPDGSIYISGRYFSYTGLNVEFLTIEMIARSLSRIPRFLGHTGEFYSVAQHSYMTSNLVCLMGHREHAMEALLHDAHEALIGDMPSPLKELCPDYRDIERSVSSALRAHFRVPQEMTDVVRIADAGMLEWEKQSILECTDDWGIKPEWVPSFPIHALSAEEAERNFIQSYNNIFAEIISDLDSDWQ